MFEFDLPFSFFDLSVKAHAHVLKSRLFGLPTLLLVLLVSLTFVLEVPVEFLSGNPFLLLDLLADGVCHVLHASRDLFRTLVPFSLSSRMFIFI
jgi:hypothetical protein